MASYIYLTDFFSINSSSSLCVSDFTMASGVKVDEVVKLKYDDIKKKKSYRYLVFYIKDEKVIQVEKVGDRNADYQEFLQDLYVGGPDDCR